MSSNQRWVLGVAAAASLLVVLDGLVVSTALSTLRLDLHASVAQLEWTVNGYALSFAVSAGCALAPSIGSLIAFRVLQGAGHLWPPNQCLPQRPTPAAERHVVDPSPPRQQEQHD